MGRPRWTVEISLEVETWYATLKSKDKAMADRALDRLAEHGPALRMPHARPLGRQRQNERREVTRARQAMRARQQTGGTDG